MALKAAFIFVAPEGDPTEHRAWVKTPQVEVLSVAAKDYEAAARVAADGFRPSPPTRPPPWPPAASSAPATTPSWIRSPWPPRTPAPTSPACKNASESAPASRN